MLGVKRKGEFAANGRGPPRQGMPARQVPLYIQINKRITSAHSAQAGLRSRARPACAASIALTCNYLKRLHGKLTQCSIVLMLPPGLMRHSLRRAGTAGM